MPTLGMGELVIILLIVVVLFGATRLPALGEGLGKAISSFRRGLKQAEDIDVQERPAGGQPPKQIPSGGSGAESVGEVRDAEVVEKR